MPPCNSTKTLKMAQWQIEYTKRFLKDLAKLPSNVQARIEAIVFQPSLSTNPFGSGHIEKMQGYCFHGNGVQFNLANA